MRGMGTDLWQEVWGSGGVENVAVFVAVTTRLCANQALIMTLLYRKEHLHGKQTFRIPPALGS